MDCYQTRLPEPIEDMIASLSTTGAKLPGIFRVCGNVQEKKECKLKINKGEKINYHFLNQYLVCDLLKDYIRSLTIRIINMRLQKNILDVYNYDKNLNYIKNLFSTMKPGFYILLQTIIILLNKISQIPSSMMNSESLATCISPTLLDNTWMDFDDKNKEKSSTINIDVKEKSLEINNMLSFIIKNCQDLFGTDYYTNLQIKEEFQNFQSLPRSFERGSEVVPNTQKPIKKDISYDLSENLSFKVFNENSFIKKDSPDIPTPSNSIEDRIKSKIDSIEKSSDEKLSVLPKQIAPELFAVSIHDENDENIHKEEANHNRIVRSSTNSSSSGSENGSYLNSINHISLCVSTTSLADPDKIINLTDSFREQD